MKGLYKAENGQLMTAVNAIHFPDGTVIQVKEHIKKKETTEIHDGWRVFYTREAALKYYGIEENQHETFIPVLAEIKTETGFWKRLLIFIKKIITWNF